MESHLTSCQKMSGEDKKNSEGLPKGNSLNIWRNSKEVEEHKKLKERLGFSSNAETYKKAVIYGGKYLDIREEKLKDLERIINEFDVKEWELRLITNGLMRTNQVR